MELLKRVSVETGLTIYLCRKSADKMYIIYEGKQFDRELPAWMLNFVQGTNPYLKFDKDGSPKVYLKWILNPDDAVVFMDDPVFTGLGQILNCLLLIAADAADDKDEPELEPAGASQEELDKWKATVMDLRQKNIELTANMKEIMSAKADLSRDLSQMRLLDKQSGASQARSAITHLKDENGRLAAQIRVWEEKYSKLEDQFNKLKDKPESASTVETVVNERLKGLTAVVNALNNVIATGDASNIDLHALSMITSTPPQAELERDPGSVKGLIAKLLGMERSGQLSTLQLKKLNSIVK